MAEPELLKAPPHNIDAEQSLLGAMMQDRDQIAVGVDILMDEHFYKDAHKLIFNAVKSLYEKGKAVDIITVPDLLKDHGKLEEAGGVGYIALLVESAPTPFNTEAYAKLIEEKWILREMIRVGRVIVEEAYTSEDEVDDTLSRAEKMVYDISQGRSLSDLSPIRDAVKTTLSAIQKRYEDRGKVSGVPTGYYDLDEVTSGLQRSDLIILAARPGMGKTSLAMNIVENAAIEYGRPVGVFSLEMSAEQLVTRMLCSVSKVDANSLRKGTLIDRDWENLFQGMSKLSDAPITIVDHPGIKTNEVRAKARRMKREHGVELIVIDYLQLMRSPDFAKARDPNRVQEVSQMSRDLKILARELQIPIIALSQLSRAVESRTNKRPMLSDLRESGSIEQDADIVMFIYRDQYYQQLGKEPDAEAPKSAPEQDEAELIIAKHRNGPTDTVSLMFRPRYTRFENFASEGY